MDSLECQTSYSLIPVSSVDVNYCVENSLCPLENTGVEWSALYINGIQHEGSSNINIEIPDYITWDYVNNDTGFYLYVGSGYDVEYIESIININSYRPTTEDFTNVFVGGLTLIMPYIIFILFLVFMRKLIKRIFK